MLNNADVHKEENFVSADYDVYVDRMLRYMPAHWHSNDFFEIYFVFSGNCPIYFKDEVVTLKPGSVMILAPASAGEPYDSLFPTGS